MLVKCLIIACVFGRAAGCGSDPPKPNVPPTIKCPSVSSVFIADKGLTTTSVTWANPTVSDPEDGSPSYKLVTGKASGAVFGRGSHSVSYVATDSGGLKDFCTFTFTVQVRECRAVHYLKNGRVDCTGNIYGKGCTFMCDDGYRLEGASDITCKKDQSWSAPNPQCIAKECGVLDIPAHGKSYVCTDERRAGSICWLTCDEENGFAPTRGQWTQCGNNQKWSNLRMTCEDIEAPVINNCPAQTVVQTKEPNSDKTEVSWPALTVTDNSGEKIVPKSRGGIASPSGGLFSEGTELVSFTAADSSGNSAEACFFIVRIQSVVCDPPKLDDPNLDTPGCVDFQEGKSCELKCYLALKRLGNKYITCRKDTTSGREAKGYWDWGQNDSPPAVKPSCEVHNCPDLAAPNYGAMVCDEWTKGTQCQQQCRDGYDVPDSSSFTNLYLCSIATGKWNNDRVTDCAYREYGEKLVMPEYYYFTGSCHVAKDEIKASFLRTIEEYDACPQKEYCTVENVVVRCGDEPEEVFEFRKKRAASPRRRSRARPSRISQYITFKISLPTTEKKGSFAETKSLYEGKLKAIARKIARVTFTAAGRTIKARRVRVKPVLPACRPGLKVGYFHKDSCVPCPVGSYHNQTRDECVACPLGQYQSQEGQSTCNLCPAGQTTITVANQNPSSCKEMCKAGHYSKNGVVPCVQCPRGSYQALQNGTKCQSCPVGMTTEKEGSTSSTQCIPYDILMQGPVTVPIEGKTPAQICDFTFAVWIKMAESTSSGVKFEVYSPVTGVGLEVEISTDVNVHILRNHHVSVTNVVDTKWAHVGVVWRQKTLTIYINGKVVKTQSLTSAGNCPAPARSAMRVAIRDHKYLYLRDLNFLTEAKPEILNTMTKTCNSYLGASLFSLEQMDMLTHNRVNEVIPSTCLRSDVCSTRPCGTNICIPRMDGHVCACRGGYSGKRCEIAPDYCKDNICRNNAKCLVSGSSGYRCECLPGFSGKLCERKIADGGWSNWMEWGECSTSCGKGTRSRHRFCTNPPPDRGGKDCPKPDGRQVQACNLGDCPECDVSTLIPGKGIIPQCQKIDKSIICSVKCEIGKVFPELPFKYICNNGFWTPTRQTLSCTDPVSPLTAGINYTVVFDNSLSNQQQIQGRLDSVGRSFTCSKSGSCDLDVGSSVCSGQVKVCEKYGGNYYGSLIVKKPVPPGQISVSQIQQNDSPYLSPLFDTWNVFKHNSDELVTPEHRALEMNIINNKLTVYPFSKPNLAVEVPGQFGNIMKTWKFLDDVNWEVRNNNYSNFDVPLPKRHLEKPLFLSATQMMTCPPGAVRGGVFCIKCPPGKMFVDGECRWCRNGFYQDETGQFSCKACPRFQTTENIGSPHSTQCTDTNVSELKLLLGLGTPGFGVFDLQTFTYKTVSLTMTVGRVDYLVYNPRDKFVYFSTQSPASIGRIGLDGKNEDILMEFPSGTIVTGLDFDVGSALVFYTLHAGILGVFDVKSSAKYTFLEGLASPRDLVLDQNFGVYWVESEKIKFVRYSSKVAGTIVTDKYAIWSPVVDEEGKRLMWQSYNRLRTAKMDGSKDQTLAVGFTSRFGHTDDYYFTVASDGSLKRMNNDLTATVSVHQLSSSVARMRVINTTDIHTVDQPCRPHRSDCEQGCFPFNTTSRTCFCADDYTLQNNLRSCRLDFKAHLVTADPTSWSIPRSADYSVPPSKTLRLKVKACHSARISLAENNRRQYIIELGKPRGNITEMSIKKLALNGQRILLSSKNANLLDCNIFKSFWITWRENVIKVGQGEAVDQNLMMRAADARPYTVNFVQFGTGINSTASWQF